MSYGLNDISNINVQMPVFAFVMSSSLRSVQRPGRSEAVYENEVCLASAYLLYTVHILYGCGELLSVSNNLKECSSRHNRYVNRLLLHVLPPTLCNFIQIF